MGIDLSIVGLIVVAIGWIVQLLYSLKGGKKLKESFLVVYCVGVLLIVIENYMQSKTDLATLNLLVLIIAVLVLITAYFKKEASIQFRTVRKKKR